MQILRFVLLDHQLTTFDANGHQLARNNLSRSLHAGLLGSLALLDQEVLGQVGGDVARGAAAHGDLGEPEQDNVKVRCDAASPLVHLLANSSE